MKLGIELAPHGTISPKKFLDYVDMLLIDDAADWADTDYDAARLLAEEKPTVQSVVLLTNLLQQWFPLDPEALTVVVNIVSLLSSLSILSAPPVLPAPLVSPPSIGSMLHAIQPTSLSNQLVLSSEIIEPAPLIMPAPVSQPKLIQYASSSIQIVPPSVQSVLPASLARSRSIQPVLSTRPIECMQSTTQQGSEMPVMTEQKSGKKETVYKRDGLPRDGVF